MSAALTPYKLLALQNKWIAAVDDQLIDHLDDVFAGKIRFIMDSITTRVTRLPKGVTSTVSADDAREMLQQLAWERIRSLLTNFDVDWQAYEDVQNGLSQLINLGHLENAKSLALELMNDGSYQVESRDED